MRIRLAIPDRHVTAPVLDAALEATTRAAEIQQLSGEAPTFTELLRGGVRWRPESFSDGEHFDLPSVVGERGWGDCDDLAPALAAELRRYDPGARARVIQSGPQRWHAIVELSDGTILDPSKMAGMRSPTGVAGAVTRPMACAGESAIALAPWHGEWWARTDLPVDDAHLSSVSHDPRIERALDRSIGGAVVCGVGVGWEHSADRTTVGNIFGDLANAAAGIIPGGSAIMSAGKSIFGGGGGGSGGGGVTSIPLPNGGKAICSPGGPIIVRF